MMTGEKMERKAILPVLSQVNRTRGGERKLKT
jgi:hypothetical protein